MSNKNTMKVASRLAIGFSIVLMLMLGVAGTAILRLTIFNQSVHTLADDRVPNILAASNWLFHLAETASHTRTMLILEDETLIKAEIDKVAKDRVIRTEAVEQLEKTVNLPAGKLALQKVIDARDNYLPYETEFLKLVEAGDKDGAKTLLMQNLRPRQREYIATLEKFVEFEVNLINTTRDQTNAAYKTSMTLLAGIALIAILVGIGAAWIITHKLVRQLGGEPDYTTDIANRIADGDLSMEIKLRVDDTTSLLAAIKQMRDKLHQIVSDVRNSTGSINTASTEIAAGNQDLSARTEQQASSLEETASSMEELTSTVKQNAENARQAVTLAHNAAEVASKGGIVVSQVVNTMGEINESAKKIVEIISVIDGIAFQTNILALNAAVEAARAGEQGRGFAVVASEVRNLAQRSASAAKEIKTLINDSVGKVDAGSRLVDQAGDTMQDVVISVRRVTDMIGEITAASQEQTLGIEQINQAIMQMDDVTQQNAALVEQAAAAATSLQSQASKLAMVVGVFRLDAPQKTATRIEKWRAELAQHQAGLAKRSRFPVSHAKKLLPTA